MKSNLLLIMAMTALCIGAFSAYYFLDSNNALTNNTTDSTKPLEEIEFEMINGISVPPEPDPELNNATLAGIDVNGNGVRDDVERMIAREFGNSETKYREALAFSKAEHSTVIVGDQLSVDVYGKAIDCSTMTSDELDPITFALLNTQERGRAYGLANAGSSGGQRNDCAGWEEEILY